MSNLCWLGTGLFCLVIGAVVVGLALLVWFIVWLLRPARPTVPAEQVVDIEAKATEAPVAEAPSELPPPGSEPEAEALPQDISAGSMLSAVEAHPELPFTVYWNRANRYAKVHRASCPYVAQHGGTHKYHEGGYEHFATYKGARQWAEGTGFPASDCKGCQPEKA